MTAPGVIVVALAATFLVTLAFLVVAVGVTKAQRKPDHMVVKLAGNTLAAAIVLVLFGSVFALGLGFGTGWQ